MKEYVLVNPFTIKTEEKDIPVPGRGEVLIKVSNVGICGSDIHLFKGTYNGPNAYPILFGHEWSGQIVKTGEGVDKFREGDFVTGDCSKYCGHCGNCETDKNLCKDIEKFGITIDGASAEYIIRDQKYLYKAPEGMSTKLLALTEPVAVAYHLLEKIRRQTGEFAGKRALIFGGGAIGQAAMMLLKHEFGCEEVYLSDLIQCRMEIAAKNGALVPDPEELKWEGDGSYFDMYNKTPFDIVIETTGVGPVFRNAMNLVRPSGVLGCVGMIANVEIPQKLIVTKSMTVVGSIGGTGEFEKVISFFTKYPEMAERLITHEYSASEMSEAFEMAANAQQALKISIRM